MTAKELAEMMINGNLDYKPENDAHWIATKYIELAEEVEIIIKTGVTLSNRISFRHKLITKSCPRGGKFNHRSWETSQNVNC